MRTGKIDISDPYKHIHDSAFGLAAGSDPGRDSEPEHGMIRYNTQKNVLEGYISNAWGELVTDYVIGGGKNLDPNDGNVTRQALQNIMSQLFSTSEGGVFVQYGQGYYKAGGNMNNDVLTNTSSLEPLPLTSDPLGYIQLLGLNASNITPLGLRADRGENYIYCIAPVTPSGSITGGFKVDFAKYFRFSAGPTATMISGTGTGGNILVASQGGKINRYWIEAGGVGYVVGDTVSISPGELFKENVYVASGQDAVVKVSEVDVTTGEITKVAITEPGKEYPPHSRYNYIYDTVSGLAGILDGTDGSGSHGLVNTGPQSYHHMHMVPAWAQSPTNTPRTTSQRDNKLDPNLANNQDPSYGVFQIVMDAKFIKQGSISGRYLVTAYKFKEYSNLQ